MSIYANGDGLLMKTAYRVGTSAPINRVCIGKVDIKKASVVHSTSEAFLEFVVGPAGLEPATNGL